MSTRARRSWLRSAVVYQVYIRSFADGDRDGVGDIAGIRSRLPYLRELGVDGIWITPWYPSPMADAGYDVADFRDVAPEFGDLEQARALIAEAHACGLRVMLDLVPNHTSDEHPWFRAALAAPPGAPERARYLFRDGRGPGGDTPPNDWRSCFGGPAWTRTRDADGHPGQWYLHLFSRRQPDLDWTDTAVRDEFLSIMDHWFDMGVDGFRIDVAMGMVKAQGLPDVGYAALGLQDHEFAWSWHVDDHPHWDRAGLHDIFRSWRALADRRPDVAFVAEAEVGPIERYLDYVRPDELHSSFNFPFMKAPWDAVALHEVIDRTVRVYGRHGEAPNWVLGNHDLPRAVTRLGDGDPVRGTRRARAAALLTLALPGGAYIYQGDELGLPEVDHFAPHERQDPIFAGTGGAVAGRDGCRVPLPWSGAAPPFGFSPTPAHADPWLRQPADWGDLTVDAQAADPASMLSLYRAALALRRGHPDLGTDEGFGWLPMPAGTLWFRRGAGLEVVVNLTDTPCALPDDARVLLASAPTADGRLPGDATAWIERG